MTDEAPQEEPEYIPDPEKEKKAKAVHFSVSIIRLLGAVMVMLGILIIMEKLPPVPPAPGYVLLLIGLAQMWFAPIWIIRKYVKARVAEEEIAKAAENQDED